MVALKYLPGIIPLVLGEYFIFTAFVAWITSEKYYEKIMIKDFPEEDDDSTPLTNTTSCRKMYSLLGNRKFYFSYFEVYCLSIESSSRSCWYKVSTIFTIMLAITRLIFFGYFAGAGTINIYVSTHGASWIYFTEWNLILVSLFYLIASIHSAIGLYSEFVHKLEFMEDSIISKLFHAVQILFEVGASTAFFITTVNFILLNPEFEFLNVTEHFVTSLSFLVEISLNSLPVHVEHIWIAITWLILYVIYAWGMVGSGTLRNWPYDFMEVEGPYCFMWYNILFIVALIFYGLLLLMDYSKRRLLTHFGLHE